MRIWSSKSIVGPCLYVLIAKTRLGATVMLKVSTGDKHISDVNVAHGDGSDDKDAKRLQACLE